MAKIVGKPNAEDVKRVAVAALVAALDDGKEKARKNPRLTGMRAVATGAVLYTAGKAAFSGRRFVRDHLLNQDEEEEAYEEDEEPVAEEDEEEEPVAEEGEDFEDEEDEEPAAEEDEDFEDEEDEEPAAEEDEDFEDEEDYDEERSAASEPPVHRDDEDIDEDDLPSRPSKKRKPVGRF